RLLFVGYVLAAAWVDAPDRLAAVLYRDELVGLSPGERGTFFFSKTPRVGIDVRVGRDAPRPWDASTSLVRFDFEPHAAVPHAGGSAEPPPELKAGDVG